jgi:hypothetical protein
MGAWWRALGGPARERRATVLSALLLLVPLAKISVLSTTNTVAARHVAFMLPFYFLLVGKGFRFLVVMRPGSWTGPRVGVS